MKWQCTNCKWSGKYEEAFHVMYSGIDWEQCPSCKSIAIPSCGSATLKEYFERLKITRIYKAS